MEKLTQNSLLSKLFAILSRTFDTGVKFEIVEVDGYSGPKLRILSVLIDGEGDTLFDIFLNENWETYKEEVDDIVAKLRIMGRQVGLKMEFFRRDQGNFGDGVCYLFDYPEKKLRLYFIRYGDANDDHTIILGGGGPKPKEDHALQENDKLKEENYLLRDIAKTLQLAIDAGDLSIDAKGCESSTDYCFNSSEYGSKKTQK